MDIVFHYPPQLLTLMVDTVPLLCRSKKDVLLFFKGAGVPQSMMGDLWERVEHARDSINKYEMARTVISRLNEKGEATLRERREALKRVIEFEDFSTCWPDDQLKAKGLVAEIRKLVDVKDSFTRMKQEREKERESRVQQHQQKMRSMEQRRKLLEGVKTDFYTLFTADDAQKRGTLLEGVLNRLFDVEGILLRESFKRVGEKGEGVIEQIDGVIGFGSDVYLAEMKWLSEPVGVEKISHHLVRVYHRGCSRGIFITATELTGPALEICKEALQRTVVTVCTLEELVRLVESEGDIVGFLKEKVDAAIIDKNPFKRIMT